MNLEEQIGNEAVSEAMRTEIGEGRGERMDEKMECRTGDGLVQYLKGCADPENARLYGNFQERAAFNITQFPKIQGSLLIRMGLVYPIVSKFVEYAGIPTDSASDFCGVAINYHTWAAGYLAYL